jgi:hypothetical protein
MVCGVTFLPIIVFALLVFFLNMPVIFNEYEKIFWVAQNNGSSYNAPFFRPSHGSGGLMCVCV